MKLTSLMFCYKIITLCIVSPTTSLKWPLKKYGWFCSRTWMMWVSFWLHFGWDYCRDSWKYTRKECRLKDLNEKVSSVFVNTTWSDSSNIALLDGENRRLSYSYQKLFPMQECWETYESPCIILYVSISKCLFSDDYSSFPLQIYIVR